MDWRPISFLHVNYKIMSKVLATRLKETLPDLISCQQTAYVKNRFIGEGGRLISDILEISNVFNLRGYVVTIDIEKVFDSLSHSFLLACLKKFGFGHDFIKYTFLYKILYFLKAKNLVLSIQELQRHTSILKKVCAKVIQFLCIFLFYVLSFIFAC